MKAIAVRYGRVVPSRDGVKYSTERLEVEVQATNTTESAVALFAKAKATVDALLEVDIDELNRQIEMAKAAGLL